MSEKFHLNTRIFRIHRFKSEFFGTYDFNLAVIFNIIFGVKEFLFEVTAFLFTCYQFIFIFTKLTFDDFFYKINRYIHIRTFLFGTNQTTLYRNCYFNFLMSFLYT